jgi:hypothetical protein
MKDPNFNVVREFLETRIKENPENQDLLTTYQKLIELKFEFDKSEVEITN